KMVDKVLKQLGKEAGIRLGASERNQLLNALSWYDENAAKVIRKVEKFDRGQLAALLQRLGCSEAELPDFGYYPHGSPANSSPSSPAATCAIARASRWPTPSTAL
ncbi:hypothetical protein AAIH74_36890, partial [Pseudomonas aeruginosa]